MSEKALKACADYARLNAEIKSVTRLLSDLLSACPGVNGHLQLSVDRLFDNAAIDRMNADKTHLKAAYESDSDESGRYFLTPSEQMEILSSCSFCVAAHAAIQERKALRKSLGATKRFITMIGRAAK